MRAGALLAYSVRRVAGLETGDTFAGLCGCGLETGDAFAWEKCWFSGCCGLAMVLLVSLVGLGEACSGAVGFIVLHAGAFRALGTSRLGTWWGFCTT